MTDELKAVATIVRHREVLADCMEGLADELRARARRHDRTKFDLDQLSGFVKINAIARHHPYGSPEYKASLRDVDAVRIHQTKETHHPEYWEDHPYEMGFLDIIEMVFDWYAASRTYGQTDFRDSLEIQRKRFQGFTEGQWWLIDQVAMLIMAKTLQEDR
jgi:hypothetical protein